MPETTKPPGISPSTSSRAAARPDIFVAFAFTRTIVLGALLAGLGGCDATDTRDGVQVIPGYMDKDQAIGTIKQVRPLESALATGDADKILNLIGWLFGNASGIVLGPSSGPTAALDSDSSADLSAAAGSATCDAAGCVFMRYLHGEPNGAPPPSTGQSRSPRSTPGRGPSRSTS